ncbi:MAG: 50S ribosomal protein L30 [Thermoflexales bacterium]|nr:50S ribosomal protein L30 [Thermoflexales bacterium]MDW8292366.1 50S ribosomal protein L30 [Anaerolineae bacterium]
MSEVKNNNQAEPQAQLAITWVKSCIGYNERQRRTLYALGLRRRGQTVTHADTPQVRGMIEAVKHLVVVKPA